MTLDKLTKQLWLALFMMMAVLTTACSDSDNAS